MKRKDLESNGHTRNAKKKQKKKTAKVACFGARIASLVLLISDPHKNVQIHPYPPPRLDHKGPEKSKVRSSAVHFGEI